MEKFQRDALIHSLPNFTDSLDALSDASDSPLVKAYLDFYSINFEEKFSDFSHGIGIVQSGRYNIVMQCWVNPASRGTLFVVHGYLDHVGLFGHIIQFALENNLSVCAFDLPGHGLSSGEIASIDTFDRYADGLQDIVNAAGPLMPGPCHVIAQSTGGAIVLNHLWRFDPDTFETIVLLAPLIRSYGWKITRWFFPVLKPFIKYTRRGFNDNTHNRDFIEFIKQSDPMQALRIPTLWVSAMGNWARRFRALPERNKAMLIIQGDADTTVDGPYNMRLIEEKLPLAKIVVVPGLRHQIANESIEYRSLVFDRISQALSF